MPLGILRKIHSCILFQFFLALFFFGNRRAALNRSCIILFALGAFDKISALSACRLHFRNLCTTLACRCLELTLALFFFGNRRAALDLSCIILFTLGAFDKISALSGCCFHFRDLCATLARLGYLHLRDIRPALTCTLFHFLAAELVFIDNRTLAAPALITGQ